MEINYYRLPSSQGLKEAWDACQFTSETDLSDLNIKSLVTINGQPILRQHHSAYLTGKDTCRAHHFAKFLATKILSTPAAVGPATPSSSTNRKVLWIDTLHGPHVCSSIYHELVTHATVDSDLHFVCLDMLGGQRDNFYALNLGIEALISRFKPALVVIDDIDHFMPYCGVKQATDFCRIVRDVTNHAETAFLFIGYNHLGKKASTTGNLGKHLFIDATDVFSLNTQRNVTTVRLVRSYDLSRNPDDAEFRFIIGPDNLPKEAAPLPKPRPQIIDDATLTDIVTDVLQPGQAVTPDELMHQVTTRHRELRQQDRTTHLLNQALRLNLLQPHGDSYILPSPSTPCPVYGGTATVAPSAPSPASGAINSSDSNEDFNTPLTLPPHPQPQA